jgi:catechol 2,3-dioxygenase-like lactoylglutathione lyase family enzyme
MSTPQRTEQGMIFQSVVMNVEDCDRSIDFYRDVFGFTLLSRKDQLAAVYAPESDRAQVIVFRSIATSAARRVGGGHVGIRALVFEVDTLDELERIAAALEKHGCLLARHGDDVTWTSVFGRDPDQIALVVGASLTTGPIDPKSWSELHDALYALGE